MPVPDVALVLSRKAVFNMGQDQQCRNVVLVGGGHAHIQVLESFTQAPPADARVTLIVDTPIAVYSGMVPGFVAGQYRSEELEIDVRPLADKAGLHLLIARAVGVDPAEKKILIEDGDPVSYDVVSFDIGSTVIGLDLPGVREHALATRPIGEFVRRVDSLFDKASKHERGKPYRVVIVGGGAGGIELAFTLQHRLSSAVAGRVDVAVVEHGSRILRGSPDALVRRVERFCQARAIEIRCNLKVIAAELGRVVLADGAELPYDALVWVTGPTCQPIFADAGLPTDDRGFVRIRSTLQVDGHDDIFAVGDCATLIDYPKTPKAGVYAVREGPYITENLRAWLTGRPMRCYKPQSDFLMLLNLGDGRALGTKWGRSFAGRWVMTLKDRIDRRFMKRFQLPDADTGS